jgi:hypothetical protein
MSESTTAPTVAHSLTGLHLVETANDPKTKFSSHLHECKIEMNLKDAYQTGG